MKFAEKFLNMMKLNDADDETEPFDEEYNEVTEEEGYDEEEMEDEEEEPHKPILSLRRKKKDLTESQEDDEDSQSRVIPFHGKEFSGEKAGDYCKSQRIDALCFQTRKSVGKLYGR